MRLTDNDLRFHFKRKILLMRQDFSNIKKYVPVSDPIYKHILKGIMITCRALIACLNYSYTFDVLSENVKYKDILNSLYDRAERMLREKKRR